MKLLYVFLLFSTVAFAQVPLETPTPLDVCDDSTDGFAVFDLTSKTDEILGELNPVDYQVTFHETLTDALNGVNQITNVSSYNNLVNPQTIYVRATDVNNATNFGTTTLTIRVLPLPIVSIVPTFMFCDSNNDGHEPFPLSVLTDNIVVDGIDYIITYYDTVEDATFGINALPQNYDLMVPTANIYGRVENSQSCYVVITISIGLTPSPVIEPQEDYIVYESPSDGIAQFDLGSLIEGISGGNPELEVTFHLTAGDAQSQTNPLPLLFTNSVNPQMIWVSLKDPFSMCRDITNLTLRVIDQLGVGENDLASLTIFPNPTAGMVSLISNTEIRSVQVIDMLGKTLAQYGGDSRSFDLSGHGKGLYFLKVSTPDDVFVRKIIVR